MTTPVLLFTLRIISAVLLLAFFAAVGWYLRQDPAQGAGQLIGVDDAAHLSLIHI